MTIHHFAIQSTARRGEIGLRLSLEIEPSEASAT